MKHRYELRRWNDDDTMTIVLKMNEEPKHAKQQAKDYANRNPGLYSLCKVEEMTLYFTEKEQNHETR